MVSDVQQKVGAILQGDRSATAWLYDTFAPRLFRRLTQRYAYPGGLSAEDLLQDSFLFYLQNDCRALRRFLERTPAAEQTEARLERYLWDLACGVATNRRRSAELRRSEPLARIGDAACPPLAERRSIDRDRLERLGGCLAESGSRLYLYFKLRYHDGYSPEEVSQITGWSRQATYRMRRALNRALERCLERFDISVD